MGRYSAKKKRNMFHTAKSSIQGAFYPGHDAGERAINAHRWNIDESIEFYRRYMEFGRNWQKISEFIQSRSVVQVVSHSQKIQKSLSQAIYNTIQQNRLKEEAVTDPSTRMKTRRNGVTIFSEIKVQEIISKPNNKDLIHQEIRKRIKDLQRSKYSQPSKDSFCKINATTMSGTEEEEAHQEDWAQCQLQPMLPQSLHFTNMDLYGQPMEDPNLQLTIKQQQDREQANPFPIIQIHQMTEQYWNGGQGIHHQLRHRKMSQNSPNGVKSEGDGREEQMVGKFSVKQQSQ